MSPKKPKRNAGGASKETANLRQYVREAIDRVWPAGIVEMPFDADDSYFYEVEAKLSRAFYRIPHARLVHQHGAEGGSDWWDGSDPDDPPINIERSRTYHSFFVSPDGEAFEYETETETFDEDAFASEDFDEADWEEDLPKILIPGKGRTGWVVAVSLLAPFAVIELGDVASFEDGSSNEVAIEPCAWTEDGERIDLEEQFRKMKGAEAYEILVGLRAKLSGILEKCGIAVLPAEEWRKPVPWLRGGEETRMGIEGKAVRVLDAFFFEDIYI